jgi:hypothetical protein
MPDHDTAAPSSAQEPNPPAAPSDGATGLDLSVLKSLSFGPDWSATPSAATLARKMGGRDEGASGGRGRGGRDFGGGGFGNGGAPGGRRDRRPTRPSTPAAFALSHSTSPDNGGAAPSSPAQTGEAGRAPFRESRGPFRENFGRGGPREGYGRHTPAPFRPTHEVLFYPDDAAFRALLKAIRTSCRTYELFEVARLILQKPERFLVVIKALPRMDGPPPPTFISQPDQLPFETEEDAVNHVFDAHLDKFCDVEVVEVEPPKGNFVGVSRCGMTGELLGPPNYHRYQQLLREHHARKLARVPFERFASRVELVKEPEQLAAWIEKMKKSTRYKLKTPIEGAPEFFETIDGARQFLLGKNKDAIVRAVEAARYPGRNLEQLPPGNIRNSVDAMLALQRRFPLETANNLRGRLRRMKFNLYKKGSKGVSYICAVKRRFRDPQTVLAEHVQKLITFIEQHPLIPALRLPHEFLGLPLPASAEPKKAEAEKPVAEAPAPAADASATPVATAETPAATDTVPVPAVTSDAKPEAPNAKPESTLTLEQQKQFRELIINLRWLVTEGYVVEYGDGKLFASPPLPAPKAKAANEGVVPAEGEASVAADEEIIEDTAEIEGETAADGFDESLDAPLAAEGEVLPESTPSPVAPPPAEAS